MLALLLGAALAAEPMTVDALAWLTGTWVQDAGGTLTEETWSPVRGATLIGTSRTVKDGATVFHEFLRVEPRDGVPTYVAWPKGASTETPFALTASGDTWARFENPKHDFPTSLTYTRTGDALHVEVRGPDGKGFALDFQREVPARPTAP